MLEGMTLVYIVCGVVAVIVVGVLVAKLVSGISRGLRKTFRGLGNVAELVKAVSQMDPKELNAEPGPKSISGVTKLLLPNISRDFPDFEYSEAKSRAENVLVTYLSAITHQDATLLSEGTSELKKEIQTIIHDAKCLGQNINYDHVHIHQTEIGQYRKTGGRCVITFQMSVEYYYYVVSNSGSVVSGSKDKKVQTRYNVDMAYIQDRERVDDTLADATGINCPNCGAPLTMLGAKKCSYCGAPVVEINTHAWNFVNVDELVRLQ